MPAGSTCWQREGRNLLSFFAISSYTHTHTHTHTYTHTHIHTNIQTDKRSDIPCHGDVRQTNHVRYLVPDNECRHRLVDRFRFHLNVPSELERRNFPHTKTSNRRTRLVLFVSTAAKQKILALDPFKGQSASIVLNGDFLQSTTNDVSNEQLRTQWRQAHLRDSLTRALDIRAAVGTTPRSFVSAFSFVRG